jgi:hypothetical protein
MPNSIKYNTSTETFALKNGNFWMGTGDVSKGPTSTTGFWNGITPPAGGYTVYLNKPSGGPSIYTCTNSAQLISITNKISGAAYTTLNECLNYYASQDDKFVTNMDYPDIITSGLQMAMDSAFTFSYPQNGNIIYDMAGGSSFSGTAFGNPSWANQITTFTVCALITKTHTSTGYANHPISKWNSGYNVNASFILYHFENYQGNDQDGVLGWYGYGTNSGWSNIGTYGFTRLNVGQTFWVALQYNSVDGGQAWVNGSKSGGRSGNNGTLGNTGSATYGMEIYMPYQGSQIGTGYISHILFYNRELSDTEMSRNYNAVSSRVVL